MCADLAPKISRKDQGFVCERVCAPTLRGPKHTEASYSRHAEVFQRPLGRVGRGQHFGKIDGENREDFFTPNSQRPQTLPRSFRRSFLRNPKPHVCGSRAEDLENRSRFCVEKRVCAPTLRGPKHTEASYARRAALSQRPLGRVGRGQHFGKIDGENREDFFTPNSQRPQTLPRSFRRSFLRDPRSHICGSRAEDLEKRSRFCV